MSNGRIHHIDLTVSDLETAGEFYGAVLPLMGFRRRADVAEGPIWAGESCELGLCSARAAQEHDRYSPGLHHLAFTASSRSAVDRLYEFLLHEGLDILDPPAEYPEYAPGYYAVFFADPDGIKLEFVYTPRWPS